MRNGERPLHVGSTPALPQPVAHHRRGPADERPGAGSQLNKGHGKRGRRSHRHGRHQGGGQGQRRQTVHQHGGHRPGAGGRGHIGKQRSTWGRYHPERSYRRPRDRRHESERRTVLFVRFRERRRSPELPGSGNARHLERHTSPPRPHKRGPGIHSQ